MGTAALGDSSLSLSASPVGKGGISKGQDSVGGDGRHNAPESFDSQMAKLQKNTKSRESPHDSRQDDSSREQARMDNRPADKPAGEAAQKPDDDDKKNKSTAARKGSAALERMLSAARHMRKSNASAAHNSALSADGAKSDDSLLSMSEAGGKKKTLKNKTADPKTGLRESENGAVHQRLEAIAMGPGGNAGVQQAGAARKNSAGYLSRARADMPVNENVESEALKKFTQSAVKSAKGPARATGQESADHASKLVSIKPQVKAQVVGKEVHLGIASPANQIGRAIIADLSGTGAGRVAGPGGIVESFNTGSGTQPLRVLTLRLEPTDLGVVRVTMRLTDGNLDIRITASKAPTAELLAASQASLRETLRNAGLRPESLNFVSTADRSAAVQNASGASSGAGSSGADSSDDGQNGHGRADEENRFADARAGSGGGEKHAHDEADPEELSADDLSADAVTETPARGRLNRNENGRQVLL